MATADAVEKFSRLAGLPSVLAASVLRDLREAGWTVEAPEPRFCAEPIALGWGVRDTRRGSRVLVATFWAGSYPGDVEQAARALADRLNREVG